MGLFGKEQITLELEKYDYTPGESIKGTVKVNLKKPVKGRKLYVELIGRQVQRQSGISVANVAMGNARAGGKSSYRIVYRFDMPLDGEKTYHSGDYPFEIKIPADILQSTTTPAAEGKLGGVIKAAQMLGGISTRTDWIVQTQLDVPMKLDVKKDQKIVISEQ